MRKISDRNKNNLAGALKAIRKDLQSDGSYLCEVAIPNREIAAVYKSEISSYLLEVLAEAEDDVKKGRVKSSTEVFNNLREMLQETGYEA